MDGRQYRAIEGASDLVTVSLPGDRSRAEAEVARHPVGQPVEVFHDPANPARASLRANPGIALTGTRSLVVAALLLGTALYLAFH